MAFTIFAIFFVTLLISFVGSLPFGPINLVMIDTTLKNSLRTSVWFAVAAAMVEIGQSWIALYGNAWMTQLIESGPWLKIAGFLFFLMLGMVFFLKKDQETQVKPSRFQNNFFLKGFIVAVLNPQAIPFWVIVLAFIPASSFFNISSESHTSMILSFVIGASFGKLGALLLFGMLSERIISRSDLIRNHINRIIGIILISIAMFQGILAFVG